MSRIDLDMTTENAVTALAEGNVGALTACMELVTSDPTGLVDLCHLDDAELYGPNIWLGYKDICGQDVKKFRTMLRDHTLGPAVKALPYYRPRYE